LNSRDFTRACRRASFHSIAPPANLDSGSAKIRTLPRFQFICHFCAWDYNGGQHYKSPARETLAVRIVSLWGGVCVKQSIAFKLNGKAVSLEVDPSRTLLWVLRDDLGLSGTKYGCGEGFCGACTVLVGRQAMRSCALEVKDVAGKEVMTIEGLEKNGKLHPLQKAF